MSTITLPWPPAVNNLYQNVGKRRIRTKRYDDRALGRARMELMAAQHERLRLGQ